MRKYTQPTLNCRRFGKVNILTESDTPKYVSSLKLLKIDMEQVKVKPLDQLPYAEDTWVNMQTKVN